MPVIGIIALIFGFKFLMSVDAPKKRKHRNHDVRRWNKKSDRKMY